MDGHQLHRRSVGVEPPGALGGDLELVVGDLLAQPAEQPDDAEPVLDADAVQRLADVADVGERALAADPAEHPRGQARHDRHLEHRGDARAW